MQVQASITSKELIVVLAVVVLMALMFYVWWNAQSHAPQTMTAVEPKTHGFKYGDPRNSLDR